MVVSAQAAFQHLEDFDSLTIADIRGDGRLSVEEISDDSHVGRNRQRRSAPGFAVAIGVFFGHYPALKASRLATAETLRAE